MERINYVKCVYCVQSSHTIITSLNKHQSTENFNSHILMTSSLLLPTATNIKGAKTRGRTKSNRPQIKTTDAPTQFNGVAKQPIAPEEELTKGAKPPNEQNERSCVPLSVLLWEEQRPQNTADTTRRRFIPNGCKTGNNFLFPDSLIGVITLSGFRGKARSEGRAMER
ncbi:hypothetical protein J6590_011704 [Homalodisca vitripennis]|nr:hypothetical protein J6590_011704 [Homalodisca vitripennis]